jgi:Kef-type K+ transport system membrane component KefB
VPHEVTLLRDIALGIVFAALAAHIARLVRQPLILGYIAGGVILSPQLGFGLVKSAENIELIAEIGLILLLFIIGLEIDLRELKRLGRSMVALGVGQFVINALLGLVFFSWLGYRVTPGNFDLLYLSIVISLSSTLIVVKLLREKFELKVLSGRLTLGVLVVQDIWAILFMAVQPNLADPGVLRIGRSIAGGAVLVAVAFLASRHVLSRVFEAAARRPELVLISAVGWCFLLSGAAERLGLSREMGALIAGVSISSFPYGSDVISKATGVRDFFVTLFFVALGMKIPVPTAEILGQAALILLFVFASRLIAIVPTTYFMRDGLYAGTVTALNLSQISEFSLVIMTLGAGYGHVSDHASAVALTAMILTSLVSPYVIGANDRIARAIIRPFGRLARRPAAAARPQGKDGPVRDIVLLGHFRIAEAVLDRVEQDAPELKERITLVDYDATRARGAMARGFHWEYGDLANPDALAQLGLAHARFVVTTISDTFLKGISTRRLVASLRVLAPQATIVMTGEEKADAEDLLRAGADEVLVPGTIIGERVVEFLRKEA